MEKIKIDYESVGTKIGEGNESEVFLYKDKNGNDIVLKHFKKELVVFDCGVKKIIKFDKKRKDRKEEKLRLLDKEPCLFNDPKVLDLVYDDYLGLVGYTMEYANLPTMNDYLRSLKSTKLKLLQSLKKRVIELNNNGLYIGDFMSGSNFLVDKDGSIKLLDQDNFFVHGLDFDLTNPYLDDHLYGNNNIQNSDNYCFNLFTLSYYTRIPMSHLKQYLKENGMPSRFNTEENSELMYDMLTKKDYKKRYFLDSQKKGLF